MRIILDQDVYRITRNFLRNIGHDVVTAGEKGLAKATDLALLKTAQAEKRILITRDKDFGTLVFLGEEKSAGVILLRGKPGKIFQIHDRLKTLLEKKQESDFINTVAVVELDRIRFRRA
jgi:predicted nuclease of predicted toxin-antitoxin system